MRIIHPSLRLVKDIKHIPHSNSIKNKHSTHPYTVFLEAIKHCEIITEDNIMCTTQINKKNINCTFTQFQFFINDHRNK